MDSDRGLRAVEQVSDLRGRSVFEVEENDRSTLHRRKLQDRSTYRVVDLRRFYGPFDKLMERQLLAPHVLDRQTDHYLPDPRVRALVAGDLLPVEVQANEALLSQIP